MTITKKTTAVAVALATILTITIAPAVNETTEFTATTLTAEAATTYSIGTYSVGTINGSQIGSNLRTGPGTNCSIIGAACYGVKFTVTEIQGDWGYTPGITLANGNTVAGYIHLGYCTYIGEEPNPDPTPVIKGKINFEAMRLYAQMHWSSYNTARYRSYKASGNDCANFCAQLVIAGGLPETAEFHGSYDWADVTSTFTYVPDLIAYMRKKYGVKYLNNKSALGWDCKDGASFSISDIAEGDLITINGTYGRNHIMYVLGVSGNYVRFAAHTNDRYDSNIHISAIAGVLKTSDIVLASPHTHSYTSSISAPGCLTPGLKVHSCSCGNSYSESIPATGHNYTTTTTQPTCVTDGATAYSCVNCGHSYTEKIQATGHSYTNTKVAPDYFNQGYTLHNCHCGVSYKSDYTNKKVLPKVTGLTAYPTDSSTIKLTWGKSSAPVNGYIVQIQTENGWKKAASAKGTSVLINNLAPGKAYRFRICAYISENGVSAYSKWSAHITSTTLPEKIKGLKLTNKGTSFLSVRWEKNDSCDGYLVYIFKNNKWTLKKTLTSPNAVSHRINELESFSDYKICVKSFKTINGKRVVSEGTLISASTTH